MALVLLAPPTMAQIEPPPKELGVYINVKAQLDALVVMLDESIPFGKKVYDSWDTRRPSLSAEIQAVGYIYCNNAQDSTLAATKAYGAASTSLAAAAVAMQNMQFDVAGIALLAAQDSIYKAVSENQSFYLNLLQLDNVGKWSWPEFLQYAIADSGIFLYYGVMNKRHKIFIAINLSPEIKRYLAGFGQQLQELPARWTTQENLHITLVFLGDLTNEEIGEVCVTVKQVAAGHEAFEINLNKVGYGPDEKIPPRFIWATGEKSKELSALKNDLQDALVEKINFKPEYKTFSPHITLARISTFLWRQIEPEERPEVGENVELNFLVESIDVMESEAGKGGAQHIAIESILLKS